MIILDMKELNPKYVGKDFVSIRKVGNTYEGDFLDREEARRRSKEIDLEDGYMIQNAESKAMNIVHKIVARLNRENTGPSYRQIIEEVFRES